MRKFLTILSIISFLLLPILGMAAETNNIITELEISKADQEMKAITPVSISIPLFLSAGLVSEISDMEVSSQLVLIGYKISENLIPYAVIGNREIGFTRSLIGNSSFGSLVLASTEIKDNDIALGIGAKGKLADLPEGIVLGYDVRYSGVNIDTSAITSLIPTWIGLPLATDVALEQRVLEASLIASKEIIIDKMIESITPYLGIKYTEVALNIKNDSNIFVNIGTEANYDADMTSMLAGISIKVNDRVSVALGGTFGDEDSIVGKVSYKF